MAESKQSMQVLNHIGSELKLLWWQMEAYQELFIVEQEKRQQLIQQTAPGFFAITQLALADSILMRISRLMDKTIICGQTNSSFLHLHDAVDNNSQHISLRAEIEAVIDDWAQKPKGTEGGDGPYAALQAVRNKWLAHNDFGKRSEMSPERLWMPLTGEDFTVARRLAERLWGLYRESSRQLHNMDVVEPTHETLNNRSAMLLKHLCSSLYLDQVLDDECLPHVEGRQAFERGWMGEDSIRPVFTEPSGTRAST